MTVAGAPRSPAAVANYKKHREENPEYHRKRIQDWSKKNPEKRKANQKRLSAKRRQVVVNAKRGPCVDCGVEYPPEVMELDHVWGTKVFMLAQAKAYSEVRIRAEIAKCELRCPNCHKIRHHYERVGHGR